MREADEGVVDVEARPADPGDRFLIEWAEESVKRNLPFANDVLRLLVTLTTSLLAGSVALLKDRVPNWSFASVALFFFLALAGALSGVMPYEGMDLVLSDPDQIYEHKRAALRWKLRRLRWSRAFLLAGFAAAVGGLLWPGR